VIDMEQKQWIEKIKTMKQEKDILVLAHYYVDGSVQEVADFVGDSYYLSQMALLQKQQVILFCGVRFMGESAKILNPDKKIIIVDQEADCPMAHMVNKEEIKKIKEQCKDVAIVCYINSTAETKAFSDVCVTSSNAVSIVKQLPEKNIFFIPDGNLGQYVQSQLPEKNIIIHEGYCYVHHNITKEQVKKVKKKVPDAKILAHPECTKEVLEMADYIGSTSGILHYATESVSKRFIICTEKGILHELHKKNPDKIFYFIEPQPSCLDMKKITLPKVYQAIKTLEPEIKINDDVQEEAKKPLERMHTLAGSC